jgi:cytochrome bd-type quinol oxidase subunit 2
MDVKTIIIGVLLLIICIGGYFSYRQFRKNNRENSFATVLFSNGMLLIVSSSSSFFDKVLVGVGVMAQYDNAVSLAGEFNKFYFGLGCVLILLAVALRL